MASLVYLKHKNGTTYVYENVSFWDKKSKKPKSKRRCIGHLDPETGAVQPNGMRGGNWKDAVPEPEKEPPRCSTYSCGVSSLLDKVCADTGLGRILKNAFPDDWDAILTCAYYLVSEGQALSRAEQWSRQAVTPYGAVLAAQRISELLVRLTPELVQGFFSAWLEHNSSDRYYCMDITGISSYSEMNEFVSYGYNRDREKLPQINLLMVKWKGHRCYLHVYFDSIKAALDEKKFSRRILMEYGELCSGDTVKEHQKDYERFFTVRETPKRGRKVEYNQEAIDACRKNSVGWFVLATNDIKDPVKALEVCRMKDSAEKHFDDLKNDLDMKRLRIHSSVAMDGRLFIQYIALILSSQIKNVMNSAGWFKSHNMQEVMDEMKSLRVVSVEGKRKQIYTTLTSFQKEIIELFGLNIG